ncbi:MAG: NAD-dependent epimerase/dehydratase family protein [Acidobacteriota bacterium]
MKHPGSEKPQRTIAVTGGAGHFGGMVMRRLVEEPTVAKVISLDVRPPGWSHPKLEGVVGDVRDPELARLLEGVDTVVHLAFLISRYKPRSLYESINVEGSKNVFRAAVAAGASQIVYSSSVAVYGLVRDHPVPITEDTPRVHQPDFSYNDAKFRVEAFLDEFEAEHPELIVTRFRMVAALSPGVESMMGRSLTRGVIPSTSDVPWPIIWGEDVADALVLGVRQRARGAFNLSTEEPMSARDLAAAAGMRSLRFPRWLGVLAARLSSIADKLGLGNALDPAWIKYSDAVLVLSSDKARRELGWQPRCNTALEVLQRFRAESSETS